VYAVGELRDSGITASVMLLAAAQDHEYAGDGVTNGVFTGTLKRVWKNGEYAGDYRGFLNEISYRLRMTSQTPNYIFFGAANRDFERQTPFTIESP